MVMGMGSKGGEERSAVSGSRDGNSTSFRLSPRHDAARTRGMKNRAAVVKGTSTWQLSTKEMIDLAISGGGNQTVKHPKHSGACQGLSHRRPCHRG